MSRDTVLARTTPVAYPAPLGAPLNSSLTVSFLVRLPKPAKLHDRAELLAQQAKSVLALLAPKDVTETRLGVGRVS